MLRRTTKTNRKEALVLKIGCLFSYRASLKVLTRLPTHQPARIILMVFCSHNVTHCTQCHICCSYTAAVPMGSLKLLRKGLTRLSQTIASPKESKVLVSLRGVCWDFGSISYIRNLDLNLPFWPLLPLGPARKVGQGRHMTAAHCYTAQLSLSAYLSLHLILVFAYTQFLHTRSCINTQQPLDTDPKWHYFRYER